MRQNGEDMIQLSFFPTFWGGRRALTSDEKVASRRNASRGKPTDKKRAIHLKQGSPLIDGLRDDDV